MTPPTGKLEPTMTKTPPPTGLCSMCSIRKSLTESGTVRLHKRHDITCDGSFQPPRPPKERAPAGSWGYIRKEIIARDLRCRKCGARDDLDVHHKLERVFGGSDDPENLITLCSTCHMEWTFCEPGGPIDFETWRRQPPARFLIGVFASEWPTDISADAFKQNVLTEIALALNQRNGGAP